MIKLLFFLISMLWPLEASEEIKYGYVDEKILINPKEEYLRYCNNLNFSFSINFDNVHNDLMNFEKTCTEAYLKKITEIQDRLGIKEEMKGNNKNISVFGVSILIKEKNGNVKKETSLTSLEGDKFLFISGQRRPFFINNNVKGNNCDTISYLEFDSKSGVHVNSLEESIPYEFQLKIFKEEKSKKNQNKKDHIIWSKSRKEYLKQDLCNGFTIYNGIFKKENFYVPIHLTINNILNNQTDDDEKFSNQLSGWCGSLVDSEQSIRIYFQENCKKILKSLFDNSCTGPFDKILGIVLHVHSRMDVCELCNASLVQMMTVCNDHYIDIQKTTSSFPSYLFDQFLSVFNIEKLDPNFRFRITASSREPYMKNALLSRRNWCGQGVVVNKSNIINVFDNEVIDFINANYIAHKAF